MFCDVDAAMGPGTTKEQTHLMLQVLLEERLKLRVHYETKEMPVYAVVVARGGPQLRKADAAPEAGSSVEGPQTVARTGTLSRRPDGGRGIRATMSVPELLGSLSSGLDRPMVDMTGLQDVYTISLVWTDDTPLGPASAPTAGGDDNMPAASVPIGGRSGSLFSAMERQLGLKVEARKQPVQMLVVDHVERIPTEN